jgi:CheY-like chemotaxis protein/signal transduction histidine kinase/CHASE3 domain sensor protein
VPDRHDRRALSRRLSLAIGIPLALLLGVGAILWMQVSQMRDLAQWVDHTDRVIARIYEVQRDIATQEASIRGYLLTGERNLLEPYEYAQPREGLVALRSLVTDNPVQVGRLEDALVRYDIWNASSRELVKPGVDLATVRTPSAIHARREAMERTRLAMVDMLRTEQQLRHERAESSKSANTSGLVLASLMFVALGLTIAFVTRRQLTAVAETYMSGMASERVSRQAMEDQAWIRNLQMQLSRGLQGELSLEQLGHQAVNKLAISAGAVVGAFYVAEPSGFRRHAEYGLAADTPNFIPHDDGLLGRVAKDQQLVYIEDAPASFLRVKSGTANSPASFLVVLPASLDGVTLGMLEFGFFRPVDLRTRELFERIGEPVALAVRSTQYRMRLRELLEESRRQTEELQTQQEELRVANEELQAQSDALRAAHGQIAERKEELEVSNASLVAQRDALERVQSQLAEKATELERANRYKSEFLANMSHELRTPLNSTLILAKLLADNKNNNLTEEQVKFANTIYAAGNDLLALINDILDLSKIEAGKVDVNATHTRVERVVDPVARVFEPVAKQKSLGFILELDAPYPLFTDEQRVQQILKNLLSNAFKFTERGEVRLTAKSHGDRVEFTVQDTGIGIPEHQHDVIFEAFRQADGTTNRRFGGTGLGLSISRDLAHLLGGELRVESEPDQGSRFILSLPRQYQQHAAAVPVPEPVRPRTPKRLPALLPAPAAEPAPSVVSDPNRRLLLIIEDDPSFADVLANLARELDFDFAIANTADDGMRLALERSPNAVVLDLQLPDHSGLSVLDRLKRNPRTRHIPVHICSVSDNAQLAFSMGAAGYLLKPVQYDELSSALSALKDRFTRVRRVLVVEDDTIQREAIDQLLRAEGVEIMAVDSVQAALSELSKTTFDCVVTDLTLPDASGFDLLEHLAQNEDCPFPPVIVYTARMLTTEEEQRLRRYSSSIIIKGARSPERLLDEVTLFLHQVESELPVDRQRMLRQARDREAGLSGRKILLAEDDVRNIFALGHVLEPKGAELIIARNGREALEQLDKHPEVDLVLMDIMMPELDGLSAMREIRARGGRFSKLPIIAITAKAMPDDQERCLQAGANDYIPKPLDVEMLLSLIRVWMPK